MSSKTSATKTRWISADQLGARARASAAKRRAGYDPAGPAPGGELPVRPTGLTIGRSEARDVILFDPAASRNRATGGVGVDMWLRDHGSDDGPRQWFAYA